MRPIKTLIIMRHGEAEALYGPGGDYARGLTEAGQLRVAQQAQRLLTSAWPLPNHVIASGAKRTADTAASFVSVLAKPIRLVLQPDLYRADADGYRTQLATLADDIECVMIVGHNPAVSWLTQTLTKVTSIDLSPAGVCVLQSQQSWSLASTFQLVAQYGD